MQEIPLSTPFFSIDVDVFESVCWYVFGIYDHYLQESSSHALGLEVWREPQKKAFHLRRCERGSLKTYSQGIWKTTRWAPTSYKLGYRL